MKSQFPDPLSQLPSGKVSIKVSILTFQDSILTFQDGIKVTVLQGKDKKRTKMKNFYNSTPKTHK